MRILLTQEQVCARKRADKLKKHAKKARAMARQSDAWYHELMSLPIDARMCKVAAHVARGYSYSRELAHGIMWHLSRNDDASAPRERAYIVSLAMHGGETVSEYFSSPTRAAAHFLSRLTW